jgi:hypothetical protein
MLRTCLWGIALTAMVAGPTAQAADTTLALACKGTEGRGWDHKSPEATNIGILVDLQKKTVVGLNIPATITSITETTVTFDGVEGAWLMGGTLDRVTGSLFAFSSKTGTNLVLSYDLKCKVTQRLF